MSEDDVRRFNILLEDIAGQVRFIAEGHTGVVERLDRVERKVDGLAEHLAGHDLRLMRIEHTLGLNGKPTPRRRPAAKRKPGKR